MKVSKFKEITHIEEWKALLADRLESKLTVSEWCKHNNLTEQQYYYRLRKVRESVVEHIESHAAPLVRYSPESSLIPQAPVESKSKIVLRYKEAVVEFSETIDIGLIANLVKELAQ